MYAASRDILHTHGIPPVGPTSKCAEWKKTQVMLVKVDNMACRPAGPQRTQNDCQACSHSVRTSSFRDKCQGGEAMLG